MTLTWFDLVVIGIVGLSAVNGLTKGIIRQGLALAGLLGGAILAGQRYQAVAERLTFLSDPGQAEVAAFILIFVATLAAATLLGQILQRVARLAMLGWADGLLGLVFGAVEAVVFIQVVLLVLMKFPLFGPLDFVQESTVGPVILKYAAVILGLFPTEFTDLVERLPTV